jgi:hypothetical protein
VAPTSKQGKSGKGKDKSDRTSKPSAEPVAKAVEAAHAHDDDLHAHDFFSSPPPSHAGDDHDHDHDHDAVHVAETPAQRERREKLKRLTGFVVAGALVLVSAAVVKAAFFSSKPAHTPVPAAVAPAPAPTTAPSAAQVETAQPAAAAPVEPAVSATAEPAASASAEPAGSADPEADKKAEEEKKAEEAKKAEEEKKAEEAKKAEEEKKAAEAGSPGTQLSAEELKALKAKATRAINSGNLKGAIEAASAAIAADPDDATMYLYLGAAYMDLGKMKEAREAFNDCVRKGKKGNVAECYAFGGRK